MIYLVDIGYYLTLDRLEWFLQNFAQDWHRPRNGHAASDTATPYRYILHFLYKKVDSSLSIFVFILSPIITSLSSR